MQQKYKKLLFDNLQVILIFIFIIITIFIAKSLSLNEEDFLIEVEAKNKVNRVYYKNLVKEDYSFLHNITGIVKSTNYIDIIPEVSGKVTWVSDNFYSKGNFRKKEKLFTIDKRDYLNQVSIKKAVVTKAERLYQEALSNYNIDKKEIDLFYNEKSKKDIKNRLMLSDLRLKEARAFLNASKAELDMAELNLEKTIFRFNFDGEVEKSRISPEQYLIKGNSYGTIYDLSSFEIYAGINQEILKSLGKIQNIIISYKDIKTKGKLLRTSTVLNNKSKLITLVIKPIENNLTLNSLVEIKIIGKKIKNIWVIPNDLLDRENHLWFVGRKNNKLVSVRIKPDIIYQNYENFIMKPIEGIDKIIISNFNNLTDNSLIELQS